MNSDRGTASKPTLIVGLPRSGTTWVGEVLSSAHRARYIFEPDNEGLSPIAWLCKQEMHRYPYLTAKDSATDYHRMWQTIINGEPWAWYANAGSGWFVRRVMSGRKTELEACMGRKTGFNYVVPGMHWVGSTRTKPYLVETHPFMAFLVRKLLVTGRMLRSSRRMIIKSVHAPLSIEWLSANFPVDVIVVLRNPYSLYASYRRMRLPDRFRNLLFQPTLQRDRFEYIPETARTLMPREEDSVAFQIMLMYKIIESQLARHPEWTPISHDRLCVTPHEGYGRLFSQLGLIWSTSTDERIDSLNKPGKGFDPSRISKQQPFKWKSELTSGELASIDDWIERFDLATFFRDRVNLE